MILYKGLQGWDFVKETFGVSDRWSHMHIWMFDSSFVIRELYLVLCFENLSRMILAYRYLQVTRCQHISRCSCITRHHPVILSVGRASSGRTDHGSWGWTNLHWSWFQCQFSLLCLEESQEVDGWPATFKLLASTVLYIVQNGGHYIFCFYFWNNSTYHI